MKIEISKTIKEEVEITFPCFFKTQHCGHHAIISPEVCIYASFSDDEKMATVSIREFDFLPNTTKMQIIEGQPICADEFYLYLERAQELQNAAILHAA